MFAWLILGVVPPYLARIAAHGLHHAGWFDLTPTTAYFGSLGLALSLSVPWIALSVWTAPPAQPWRWSHLKPWIRQHAALLLITAGASLLVAAFGLITVQLRISGELPSLRRGDWVVVLYQWYFGYALLVFTAIWALYGARGRLPQILLRLVGVLVLCFVWAMATGFLLSLVAQLYAQYPSIGRVPSAVALVFLIGASGLICALHLLLKAAVTGTLRDTPLVLRREQQRWADQANQF